MSWIVIKCLGISLVVGKFVIKWVVLNIKKNLNAQLAIKKKKKKDDSPMWSLSSPGLYNSLQILLWGLDEVFSLWFTA